MERKSKASVIAQQEVKMQKTTSTSNVKLVEVEVRADSLEKELYEKNLRAQEKRWRRSLRASASSWRSSWKRRGRSKPLSWRPQRLR